MISTKIFQVVPYYPPHVGGMEYYVQRLSEELSSRGHEVTIFTSALKPNPTETTINGVKVCSLKIMTKIYNVPIVPSLFWKLLNKEKPDLIHTHQYPVFFSDISASISWLKKIPLLLQVHIISDSKSTLSGLISNLYYSTLGLNTLRKADSVIVPSLAYKNKLLNMNIIPENIHLIPYGIDTKKFNNRNKGEEFKLRYNCQNSKVILTVGRLSYQKGFQYLIKAMKNILKYIPSAKLVIVGEGEQLVTLRQLATSLDIAKSVVFTGALTQQEIPNAYAACDVFVLPSLFESFGISLIEAQVSGKPVIGTSVGGIPEAMLNGKTGLIVEPGNPDALERAVVQILLDNTLANKLGQNGKYFVENNFSIKSIVSRIIESYENIISK